MNEYRPCEEIENVTLHSNNLSDGSKVYQVILHGMEGAQVSIPVMDKDEGRALERILLNYVQVA